MNVTDWNTDPAATENNAMPIVIDDREQRSGVPAALEETNASQLSIERLPVGDYLVDRRFLYERKTLPDFINSLIGGRLFEQALRLISQERFHPVLVLEGTARDCRGSKIRREAIQGALITLSLMLGLPVLRTRSPPETAAIMLYAALQGRATACRALPRHGYRRKGKAAVQSYILQGIPTVGPARARELIQHFGSVGAALTADEEALRAVDGIGARTARVINWACE